MLETGFAHLAPNRNDSVLFTNIYDENLKLALEYYTQLDYGQVIHVSLRTWECEFDQQFDLNRT